VNTAGQSALVQFGVTASAGASPTGAVVFRVQRQGAAADQSKEYTLQLMQ
jgi:hypothetical protein